MNEPTTPLDFTQTVLDDPSESQAVTPVLVSLPNNKSSPIRLGTEDSPESTRSGQLQVPPLSSQPDHGAPASAAASRQNPSTALPPAIPARPSLSRFSNQPHRRTFPLTAPKAFAPSSLPSLKQRGLLGPAGYFSDIFFRLFAGGYREPDRDPPKRRKPSKAKSTPSASLPPSHDRLPANLPRSSLSSSPSACGNATSGTVLPELEEQQHTSHPPEASRNSVSSAAAEKSQPSGVPAECSQLSVIATTAAGSEEQSEVSSFDDGLGLSSGDGGTPNDKEGTLQQINRARAVTKSVLQSSALRQDRADVASSRVAFAVEGAEAAAIPSGIPRTPSELGAQEERVNIIVQDSQHPIVLTLNQSALVDDLYDALSDQCGLDAHDEYLVYGDKLLRTGTRLVDCGVRNGSIVFMHARLRGGGKKRIMMDDDDWDRYEAAEEEEARRPAKRQSIPYMEWLEERNHRLERDAIAKSDRIKLLEKEIDGQESEVRQARRTVKRAQQNEDKYRQVAFRNLTERQAEKGRAAALEEEVARLSSSLAAVQRELEDQKRSASTARVGDEESLSASPSADMSSPTTSSAAPASSTTTRQPTAPLSRPFLAPLQISATLPAPTCRPVDLSFLTPPPSPETPSAPVLSTRLVSGLVEELAPIEIVDQTDLLPPTPIAPLTPPHLLLARASTATTSASDATTSASDGAVYAGQGPAPGPQFYYVNSGGERKERASPSDGEIEPMQQQLEQVWLGRPVGDVFGVPPFAQARSNGSLIVLDFASLTSMVDAPPVLFQVDPTFVDGNKRIYAALKFEEPLTFARQFPGYCGDVQFRLFLHIVDRSERFVWWLFTVSKPYLLQLLTCTQVKRWAENPRASGQLLVSHSLAHKARKLVEEANEIITLYLLSLGIEPEEARRPRFVVQQIRATGVPSVHSKTMTAISKDHSTLYVVEGSANPSQRGFAGVASDDQGAAREPASHETAVLFAVPVHSVFAQHHLRDLDSFFGHLARTRRLLITNSSTTAPIQQAPEVAHAEATLQRKKENAGISAAEAALADATTQAWTSCFETIDSYDFPTSASPSARSPVSLELGIHAGDSSSARTPAAKSKRLLRLPNVARTLSEALAPPSASVARWEAKKLKAGETMITGEIVCGDCARQFRGSLPPAKLASYSVNHPHISPGCPAKLQPTRSTFVSDEMLQAQPGLRADMYNAQMKHAIIDPFTGRMLVQLGLSFYDWLPHDLNSSDEIRISMGKFLEGVDPAHPQLHGMKDMLKKAETDFTHLMNFLQKIAAPALGKRFESTRSGRKVRQRPFYAGALKTVVRHCYSYGGGEAAVVDGADNEEEDDGGSEDEREDEDEDAGDDDDDGPQYS